MTLLLVAIAGSVAGRAHRLAERDSQDGHACVAGEHAVAGIVTDGCGCASEIGARIGAAWLAVLVEQRFGSVRDEERARAAAGEATNELLVRFDADHVLFCTATEKAGRVIHTAHLVDDRGELLATETGPAGSSAILAGIPGKCLARGAVLVATDDGLVLVRADRATRSFVPLRAFPEARDLVPPDADLLVGPGGSVYVVTHDEIVHLYFEGNPSP